MGSSRKARRAEHKERKRLRRMGLPLQSGESIVLVSRPSLVVTWPKYVLTLGLYGLWRKRNTTVLTNRRVLINRGFVSRSERSLPFSRIADARYARRGLVAYANLILRDSNRVERVGPMPPRQARRIASEVLDQG